MSEFTPIPNGDEFTHKCGVCDSKKGFEYQSTIGYGWCIECANCGYFEDEYPEGNEP